MQLRQTPVGYLFCFPQTLRYNRGNHKSWCTVQIKVTFVHQFFRHQCIRCQDVWQLATDNSILTRRRFLPMVMLGVALVLGGCLSLGQEEITAALPLNENLPASWTPLDDVQAINIDDDAATEYLLYFTYDGSNGPVGAVIYNTETDEDPGSDDGAANRLSTSFIPYAVLPSYRPGTGQGYIAEPAQRNAIGTFPVSFQNGTIGGTASADGTATTARSDALAILGGVNYLTWVWWQPQNDRYGVTQLYSTDRFETPSFAPFPWESWRAAPTPIRDIVTVQQLHDRNQLCRRMRHLMLSPADSLPANGFIDEIRYRAYDLGLSFCRGVPELPFYPEGVVLAYLTNGEPTLWDQELLDATTRTQLINLVAQPQIIRINDLAGYQTIPDIERTLANSAGQRTEWAETSVCVEVIMPAGYVGQHIQSVTLNDVLPSAEPSTTEGSDGAAPYTRRWLLFTLRHEPPHREPATPDRLYIMNVQPLPVSAANGAVDCRQRLEG